MSGSSSTINTRSMPYILTSNHENHHLSDVGRVIPNALQVLGDENQLERSGDVACIFHHIRQQLSKDLFIQIVDGLIFIDDSLPELCVGIHKSVETFLQDTLRCFSHNGQCD